MTIKSISRGKIVETTFKRKYSHYMPQYYQHLNVKISPLPVARKIFKWFPYFVGQKVSFEVSVENPPEGEYAHWNIIETIGGKASLKNEIGKEKIIFIGSLINAEGDIEYSIGSMYHTEGRQTIFTAKALNFDSIFFAVVGAIFGAVLALLAAIAAGAIEIDKFWRIINPFLR
jgi:hypothetical protein